MNVHSYCTNKVANLCGINQKLLAEALSQVSQVCTVTGLCLSGRCIYLKTKKNSFIKAIVTILANYILFSIEIYKEVR